MLVTKKKIHGVSFATIWYAPGPVKQAGVLQYREAIFEPKARATKFHTLLSDLTETEEDIIAKFSKNCLYEVRRAPKENVKTEMKTGDSLTKQDIQEFCDFFVKFWASKGVEYKEEDQLMQELSQYADNKALAIANASICGKKIVYHTYVTDETCVRLYHSASLYRQDVDVEKKIIGMANRYLHKEDMLYFKAAGKTTYDWGGAGTTEDVMNITKFKQSFGGIPVTYYDATVVKGLKAKIVIFLSSLKHRI